MKLGDTKRLNGATCRIVEFCDEPNRGLVIIEEMRDVCPPDCTASRHVSTFLIPIRLWEAVQGEKCPRCRGTGTQDCDDPQCSDSTWDHDCNAGQCDSCDGSGLPAFPGAEGT